MAYIGKFRDKWRCQIQRDGIRVSKVFNTKREAAAWAIAQDAKTTLAKQYALSDACAKYLETVTPHKRSALIWERARMTALMAHFGPVALSSITSESVGQWRDARLKTVSGSTVLRESGLYRHLFRLAKTEWKWIDENPFDGVRWPKASRPRQSVWRWQDIKRVLRAGQRMGGKSLEVTQAFHIALRTGMRLKEAMQAPAGFNPARKVVVLESTKTAAKGETVPLTRQGYRLMLTMPKSFTLNPILASTLFCQLCDKNLITGLQFRDARATALTLMARKMDVLTLARISRHSDLRMLSTVYYRESADEIAARL